MGSDGVIEDTKEEVKQRLKSPYAGSYVLAWCAVNYEFLIVVFSGGDYTYKIGYIARHLEFGQSTWVTFGLPAVLAFVPVLALPLLNQFANLWSKGVEVGATYLSVWMETGKRVSDDELRLLARNRLFALDALRKYSRELFKAHAALAYAQLQQSPPGKADWVQLAGSTDPANGVVSPVAEMVERAGFPRSGYEMLQLLQREGLRTEDQLRSSVTRFQAGEEARDIIGLLNGAQLIDLKWTEGPSPSFYLTRAGAAFLGFVAERHPEAFSI